MDVKWAVTEVLALSKASLYTDLSTRGDMFRQGYKAMSNLTNTLD